MGNAASGGWSGIQFPVLPEPADKMLRYNGVVPKDRPSLLITGNSIHSSSWFAQNSGAMYEGGSLYWATSDVNSETLIYNAGRVSSTHLTRTTKDENGNDDWFRVHNTTVWLVSQNGDPIIVIIFLRTHGRNVHNLMLLQPFQCILPGQYRCYWLG